MASADAIARSIEPGSTEYGERQEIASRLDQALSAAPQPGPAVAPGPAPASLTNPMDKLLGGGHSSDLPVTAGLPVGPGPGPASASRGLASSPKAEQLRAIATSAKSPILRQLARDALAREIQNNL